MGVSVSFLRIVTPSQQHKFTSERQRTRLFSHPLSTGNKTYAINFLRQTPNAQRALSSSQHVSLQSACPEGRTDRKRHVCPTLVWPGCKETAEGKEKEKKERKEAYPNPHLRALKTLSAEPTSIQAACSCGESDILKVKITDKME